MTTTPASWLEVKATDADLADMLDKTRTSILHSREHAGWKYLAMATTVDGYGEFDIHVLPHTESGDPEGQDLVPVPDAVPAVVIPLGEGDLDAADATYDAALGAYGWERVGDWEPTDFGGIVEVKRSSFVDKGGRPPIGPSVKVAMKHDLLGQVEAYAARNNIERPEAIRILVAKGLEAVDPWSGTDADAAYKTGVQDGIAAAASVRDKREDEFSEAHVDQCSDPECSCWHESVDGALVEREV